MVITYRPKSLMEALEAIEFTDYTVFAGGTDLMVKRKQLAGLLPSFDKPVMFISDLSELKQVTIKDGFLYIGAACTFTDIIENYLIPEFYKEVFMQIASPAIRNSATIGGNICNSSPAADSLPLLYALDAALVIENSCRRAELPISDFITGPGRNILTSSELVTAVKLPIQSFEKTCYKKVSSRRSNALSKISFVALANIENDVYKDIRIAFGSVAPTVIRSLDIEEDIITMSSQHALDINQIARDYATLIKPIDDQRSTAFYRKEVCNRLLADFLGNYAAASLQL
jgi:CO/xanthine dehydrogenase FAD-binding subunit